MRSRLGLVAAVLMAGGALAALVSLMLARFEAGDLYPPYSSLRPDPLGTAALYEALEKGPMEMSRLYGPLSDLGHGADITLLYLGVDWRDPSFFDAAERRGIEEIASSGGRVCIALLPTEREKRWRRDRKAEKTAKDAGPPKAGQSRPADAGRLGTDDWQAPWQSLWGLKPEIQPLERGPGGRFEAAQVFCAPSPCPDGLPASLPWRSALTFERGAAWTTLYAREGRAVVLEKRVGLGGILVLGDGFLLSNEGLSGKRESGLLTWLLTGRDRLVFDERHLGVTEQEGVAGLARKLGLMPAVAVLVFAALMSVWRIGSPLVPPWSAPDSGAGQGKGSGATLSSLIRRHQKSPELFRRAWDDFCRSQAAKTLDPRRRAKAEGVAAKALETKNEDALRKAWDDIAKILKNR